jgi:hypothetical protein
MTASAFESRRSRFERIYNAHSWGGVSKSGPGSDPQNTKDYVKFIEDWLATHPDIRSIVELGCGDWSTTKQIRFEPHHEYLGLDIVDSVIDQNVRNYGSANIRFLRCDFVEEPPPAGDVLIAKDVLQHLSNESILRFLQTNLSRYRFAIFTNDVAKVEYVRLPFGLVYVRKLDRCNRNIEDGESRPVLLGEPPFNLEVVASAEYENIMREKPRRIVYTKQIVVWARAL